MERPPKRSASGEGFSFDGPEIIWARLNQTLTRPSDWVHLGEIVVIHAGIRPPGLRRRPRVRFAGRLPYGERADISPATPNHRFLFKDRSWPSNAPSRSSSPTPPRVTSPVRLTP